MADIDHVLGRLEQGVTTLIDDAKVARENRREIYKLVGDVNLRLARVEDQTSRTAPLVEKHERAHNRRAGAYALAGTLGAAIAFGASFVKDKVFGWI